LKAFTTNPDLVNHHGSKIIANQSDEIVHKQVSVLH
jgi:hypothetical protein